MQVNLKLKSFRVLVDATPQNPQPCKILWRSVEKCRRNAGDIRDRKFVLPKKVGQSPPKIFRGCYPIRPPIMPNFIEIGQTSLEIGVGRIKNFHTQTHTRTDTRHPDWLSRASQHARGATIYKRKSNAYVTTRVTSHSYKRHRR